MSLPRIKSRQNCLFHEELSYHEDRGEKKELVRRKEPATSPEGQLLPSTSTDLSVHSCSPAILPIKCTFLRKIVKKDHSDAQEREISTISSRFKIL